MATIDLGKIAFTQKGTWASGTAYTAKDVVQYTDGNDTSSYVAIASSTGQAPSTNGTVNTSNWAIFAKGSTVASNYQSSAWASGTTYTKGDITYDISKLPNSEQALLIFEALKKIMN